jgi:hypothetical protein
MKVTIHPVAVPELRKLPRLLQRQCLTSLTMVTPPPQRPFFRPEEQDVRSGEDQIVVPLAKRQSKIDSVIAVNAIIRDAHLGDRAGVGVDGLNARIHV